MSQKLISILRQAELLERKLIENHGELTPEMEALISATGTELMKKVDGLAYFLDSMSAKADFWKKKAEEFDRYQRACENAVARIRENVKFSMVMSGTNEITGKDFRFVVTPSNPSLRILNAKDLPREFIETIVTEVPRKDLIKTALKEGIEVPGACLDEVVSLRRYAGKSPVAPKKKEKGKVKKITVVV